MPTYKLTYFDGRGRAEIIRLMFVAGGIPFEDIRVTQDEWKKLKPNTPYGTLPTLEVDGQVLGQSIALARMAAGIAGLNGTTNVDQAKLDAYVDVIIETREECGKFLFKPDSPEKTEAKKKYFEEFVPSKLKLLESKATENGYFLGNKISWADIALYSITEVFTEVDIVKDFPKLKKIAENVKKSPKVAAYISKRKSTSY